MIDHKEENGKLKRCRKETNQKLVICGKQEMFGSVFVLCFLYNGKKR